MYSLTLTYRERKAIDWTGYRYFGGDDLREILESSSSFLADKWDDKEDISFNLPENLAWEIREGWEREDRLWPCFSTELASKLNAFIASIV